MPKIYDYLVLDDMIQGTSAVYSLDEFNSILPEADTLVIAAVSGMVGGTNPTLTVGIDYTADGINWWAAASALINSTLSTTGVQVLTASHSGYQPTMSRLRVALAGTTPQARIRLYVTGRTT